MTSRARPRDAPRAVKTAMNQHAAPPEFAMSFTQEAVRLECRNGPDWRPLGHARFAGGDMAAVLNGLREQAGGQAGELDTVLVIPDDQILYTVLTVPFGSDTAATIARALEASTPYPRRGSGLRLVPPRHETGTSRRCAWPPSPAAPCNEAEDFARAQGFRPSGFQARPGDDRSKAIPISAPRGWCRNSTTAGPSASRSHEPGARDRSADRDRTARRRGGAGHLAHHPACGRGSRQRSRSAATDTVAPPTGETPAAVIRHGSGPLTAKRLSPRAEAVHSRAAAARAERDAAAPAEDVRTNAIRPPTRPGPGASARPGGRAGAAAGRGAAVPWPSPRPQEELAQAPVPQAPVQHALPVERQSRSRRQPAPQAAIPGRTCDHDAGRPRPCGTGTSDRADDARTARRPGSGLAEALAQARAPALHRHPSPCRPQHR